MRSRRPYILLVDDDSDDQELFIDRFHIRNPGKTVKCLPNGYQVLGWLENCPNRELPCLLLLDYKMPGLTGADVLKRIEHSDRYKDMSKVVWSSSNNQVFIDECMRHGADRYFTKPSDVRGLDKLIDTINALASSGEGC